MKNRKQDVLAKQWQCSGLIFRADGSFGVEPLLVSLAALVGVLTVNTAGAAVQRVVDEEITLHTELTVTCWTGEDLQTHTSTAKSYLLQRNLS